jgi:putative SOS response-associated peptidase YedK
MCYSAEVQADYKKYTRLYGAHIDIETFYDLYWRRAGVTAKLKTPKAMDAWFEAPQTNREREIKELIDRFNAEEERRLQQTLFEQRTRLVDAERKLAAKHTKAAAESARIAANKVADMKRRLDDLHRTELLDQDARIFPGMYAPVMVMENGQRAIKPMRYQCRPAGKPASYDRQYPGTYNARRDNLEGFWKSLFGFSHGVMIVNAFYENVPLHKVEGRELAPGETAQNAVLQFKPRPAQDMLVACLWSQWQASGDEPALLSFAAISDEPPPEIAAAGHDRCIVPIKPEHIDAWLNPDRARLAEQYAILDDRPESYFEHRMAA